MTGTWLVQPFSRLLPWDFLQAIQLKGCHSQIDFKEVSYAETFGANPASAHLNIYLQLASWHLNLQDKTLKIWTTYLSMMPAPTPVLVMAPFKKGIPSTAVRTVCESGSFGYTNGTVNTTTRWLTVAGRRAHLSFSASYLGQLRYKGDL